MHERIKKIRKVLDLTQREFGERIGVKPNTIATYEIGRNQPIDAVISLICREFNVSETWLRTGDGDMFVPSPNGPLEAFIRERGLSASDRILIEKFAALDSKSRQAVMNYVLSVAADYAKIVPDTGKNIHVPAAGPSQRGLQEMTREEMHAALDRQLDEEKEAAENVSGFGHGQSGRATG